ncbi:uncharacterized protein C12orf40 homolog [Suncus etruscus]|uniref:uncharacterized protein C12orf40 homolog n=1 Tax=Suncus etruscus TaxID=109475 RepID=UPI002110C117|nr:uncharacterized protein C12orf40 homolog [Suncus etruscus]
MPVGSVYTCARPSRKVISCDSSSQPLKKGQSGLLESRLRAFSLGRVTEMNWVGGSRTRILTKQERRKQKEYFEKKKLKSKMKLLGMLSPVKHSAVSLDLLNLYIVNKISCQKKTTETVRRPTHVNMNKDVKMPFRKQNLEFPMSPPSRPSNLCIDDLGDNTHYQIPGNKEEHGTAQLHNVNYSNTLASKLYDNRDALSSSYKTGPLFGRLNSPGNRNLLSGRPVVNNEAGGSTVERRQPDFLTDKQPTQSIWRESAKEVPEFLEDVNQPTPSLMSKKSDSLIGPNMINLLAIDQKRVKKAYEGVQDFDSPSSSQSASYSPRQTDSHFSSSSEMSSEDEDSASQQMEESERPIRAKETSNNTHPRRMTRHSGEKDTKDGARTPTQSDPCHQFSGESSSYHFSQSQSYSAHTLQHESSQDVILQGARCDVGVQTESWPAGAVKVDVAVQCGRLSPGSGWGDTERSAVGEESGPLGSKVSLRRLLTL